MYQVKHVLSGKGSEVIAIDPDAPVLEAIRQLAERRIGAILVMRDGQLHGILSERDYTWKVFLKGRSSRDTAVREIMIDEVMTVTPEDSVEHCMHLCTDNRVRHLPVVEQGKVVGVVSLGDLVKAVIDAQNQEIEHLQAYIAG